MVILLGDNDMEKTTRPPFIFIGEHPCVDWINTRIEDRGAPIEFIRNFSDLLNWLTEAKLLNLGLADKLAGGKKEEEDGVYKAALAFRSSLRKGLEAIASSKSVPGIMVEAINKELAQPIAVRRFLTLRKNRIEEHNEPVVEHPIQIMALLAESAADFLSTADIKLVRKCANPQCVAYFYDMSKNHARRWCSMKICGNRMKVAAYQRRFRTA